MLQLILGPSGAGKTAAIRSEMRALAEKGKEVYCIVPEQYSFESERALYPLGVECYSFERLTDAVMRRCGGLAGEYAGETVQLLFMRRALKSLKGNLCAFDKVSLRPDFAGEMLRTVLELKRAGIRAEDLRAAGEGKAFGEGPAENETAAGSVLRLKLYDLSLILESYDALLSRSFLDPADRLSRAAEMVGESGFFKGSVLFLDEFKSFTAVQLRMIRLMLSQAEQVTVSLCLDPEHTGAGLFGTQDETRRELKRLAAKAGVPVCPERVIGGTPRFSSPEIPLFGKGLFAAAPERTAANGKAVRAFLLRDEYEEASFAAAEIMRLVRDEEYAYEDIAVLARDLSVRAPSLEAAFDRYGVPYFLDGGRSVEAMPLTRFVRHLLLLMLHPLDREESLMLLKCGVLPVEDEAVSAFEQYTYVWDVTGYALRRPFTRSPGGFSEREMSERDTEKLRLAEETRTLLVGLYDRFKKACEKDGIARGIYRFLTGEGIDAALQDQCDALLDEGQELDAENLRLSWDSLMEFLDAAETIRLAGDGAEGEGNDFAAFSELLAASAAETPLITRPQTLDSVFIGDPAMSRVGEKKCVLILGCNEGLFPAVPESGGTLKDTDREEMARMGFPIGGRIGERLSDERFAAYKAVMTPSEQLVLTAAAGEVDGSEKSPSEILLAYSAVFDGGKVIPGKEISPYFYAAGYSTAFWQAARLPDGKERRTLEAALKKDPVWRQRLTKLYEASEKEEWALRSPELAHALFAPLVSRSGKPEAVLSPSQIEQFYSCPFAYFCRYGLALRPPVKAELNPLARGSIIHFLLQRALSEKNFLTLDEDAVLGLTDRLLAEYLDGALGGGEEKSGKFLYYFYRLRTPVSEILTALQGELAQTEFKVCGLEETIAAGGKIRPLTVEGEKITLKVQGKIDRIDAALLDGEEYVRVIDYKTGGKQFKLSDAERGLSLQMLLYLFAATEGGAFQGATPAGILYMPAGSKSPVFGRGEGDEAERKKLYRMNGLVLDEERVLRAMERDGAGGYIDPPSPRGKKNARISREELSALREKTEELVREMGENLMEGNIAPAPQSTGSRLPCGWCEYKGICGVR